MSQIKLVAYSNNTIMHSFVVQYAFWDAYCSCTHHHQNQNSIILNILWDAKLPTAFRCIKSLLITKYDFLWSMIRHLKGNRNSGLQKGLSVLLVLLQSPAATPVPVLPNDDASWWKSRDHGTTLQLQRNYQWHLLTQQMRTSWGHLAFLRGCTSLIDSLFHDFCDTFAMSKCQGHHTRVSLAPSLSNIMDPYSITVPGNISTLISALWLW